MNRETWKSSCRLAWKDLTTFSPIRKYWDEKQARQTATAIFIWIPKTAGTSIAAALKDTGCRKFKSIKRIQRGFYPGGFATFSHLSLAELVEAGVVPISYYRQAFRFAFVRDPVSRTKSLYGYLLKKKVVQKDLKFTAFLDLVEREFDKEEIDIPWNDRFTRRLLEWEGDDLRFHGGVAPRPGLFNSFSLSQCRPQVEWLRLPHGEKSAQTGWGCAGFIGKLEKLPEELLRLRSHLGTPVREVPHLNVSQNPGIRISANDASRIQRLFRRDYEAFGYSA